MDRKTRHAQMCVVWIYRKDGDRCDRTCVCVCVRTCAHTYVHHHHFYVCLFHASICWMIISWGSIQRLDTYMNGCTQASMLMHTLGFLCRVLQPNFIHKTLFNANLEWKIGSVTLKWNDKQIYLYTLYWFQQKCLKTMDRYINKLDFRHTDTAVVSCYCVTKGQLWANKFPFNDHYSWISLYPFLTVSYLRSYPMCLLFPFSVARQLGAIKGFDCYSYPVGWSHRYFHTEWSAVGTCKASCNIWILQGIQTALCHI